MSNVHAPTDEITESYQAMKDAFADLYDEEMDNNFRSKVVRLDFTINDFVKKTFLELAKKEAQ